MYPVKLRRVTREEWIAAVRAQEAGVASAHARGQIGDLLEARGHRRPRVRADGGAADLLDGGARSEHSLHELLALR